MEKILIYTAYNDSYSYIGDLTSKNIERYAKIHKYDFLCKRNNFTLNTPISWDKINTCISLCDKYDYILWMDADAFVVNPNITINELLLNEPLEECVLIHGENPNLPALTRVTKKLKKPKNPFFWTSICNVNGPCLGVFLIRCCEESKKFLNLILDQKQFLFDPSNWWDQRAFHELVFKDQINTSNLCIFKHNVMNSYHCTYSYKDFAIHLPATLPNDRIKYFNKFNLLT